MDEQNKKIEPRVLKGFRDILALDFARRKQIIDTISQTLDQFGFTQIETPALEYAEILTGKIGEEGEKLLYQFTDHGNRQVAMRYDFTVPLARVIAQHKDISRPFKRFQVGPVWRADNTQRGRYREFYQFDFDIVGVNSEVADAEILVAMQQILLNLKVPNFTIRVNNRQYLENIARAAQLNPDLTKIFYTGLDKWDKIGGADAVQQYWQNNGLSQSQSAQLLALIEDSSTLGNHPTQSTINLAISMGLDPKNISIDPTIVRGLDYYTGIVYETTLNDAPEFGSVFSGGRYDGLIGRFSNQDVPAVGASVGLDRLIAALEHLEIMSQVSSDASLFVTVFNQDLQAKSLEVTQLLRKAGYKAEVYLDNPTNGLGKQLKLANTRQASYAVIIGPEEAEDNTVKLKDLTNGQEKTVSIEQLVNELNSSR